MSSRDNLLDDKKNCSFEGDDVDNVCYTDTNGTCGDGSIDVTIILLRTIGGALCL